jgi:hypothetical protein
MLVVCGGVDVIGVDNTWGKWCLGFLPVNVAISFVRN